MRRRQLLLGAFSAVVWSRAFAQTGSTASASAMWAALRTGGVAILLRHAQTEPGVGDPPGFRIGECSTQRNLSEEGRRQAQRIGASLAAQSIRIDRVLSSQWCRCLDTARLAFPAHEIEPLPALNSFFGDRSREPGQTKEARGLIAAIRAPRNIVFVTHQVNIVALTGEAVGSGEAVLLLPPDRTLGRLGL